MNKKHKYLGKKMVSFLVSLSMLLMYGTMASFASSSGAEEMVTFEGKQYDKNSLSQETLNWIEAYNALPEHEKAMISHVPYELRALQTKSMGGRAYEAGSEIGGMITSRANLLPTSGGEPVYNPSYWNSSENIYKANCYAYAMDVVYFEGQKLQPGELAGDEYKELTASDLISSAKKDGPYLGNGRTLVESNANSTSTSKSYKVALVIDAQGYMQDYHWYVQNSNGYWSHKRGFGEASDLDASGNYITNPQSCDRNYGNDVNYSTWGGFVMVTRK